MNGHGAATNYTLDPAGNITRELVSGDGAKDVTYAYTGSQLTSITAGGVTQRQWYDPNGNLDCVTLSTGSQANCAVGSGGSYSAQVLAASLPSLGPKAAAAFLEDPQLNGVSRRR